VATRRLTPAQLAALHERAKHAHTILGTTKTVSERLALLAAVVWPTPDFEEEQIRTLHERERAA
jgi:hypothetical protein